MKEKNEQKLKKSTILSYAFAQGSGYQIMGSLVGTYLLIFLTDTFGVPAYAAGAIMVIASIWDAVNDPIMGTLADRTKSRWGKYRPYFLFVPVPLAIVVVLLFLSPNLGDTGKIIWTAVFYILYGMLRTAIEIPCGAIINAVTNQDSERSKMISAYTIVMGIFTTLTTSFALALISIFGGGNTAKGYMIVVGIAGILMVLSCWWCFSQTEEKYVIEKPEKPIFAEIKELVKIKGLLPVVFVWLGGFVAYNIMMSSSVYYLMYYACRPDLISWYMLDISVIGLIGIAAVIPLFMKWFHSVKKGYLVSQIIVALCSIVTLVFGKNLVILFVFSGLASMFATLSMPYNSMVMTEMTDYVYLKSGNMMNGTMAALKGFTNKCGIAIASGIISTILGTTGYIAGAIGQQPEATLIGINIARFGVPVVMALLIIISLKVYPVTETVKKEFINLYKKEGQDEIQ